MAVVRSLNLNPIDQYNRVVDENARQRNETEQGHEAEPGAGGQQPDGDTDQSQGHGQQDHSGLAKRVELQHQEQRNQEAGDGEFDSNGGVRIRRTLVLATVLIVVAGWPVALLGLQPGVQGCDCGGGGKPPAHVGGHGDVALAVLAVDQGRLPLQFGIGNIAKRNIGAHGWGVHRRAEQFGSVLVITEPAPQEDGNQVLIRSVLAEFDPGQPSGQRLGDPRVGDSEGLGAHRINAQHQLLGGLAPVVTDVERAVDALQLLLHLAGESLQLIDVRSEKAHADGVVKPRAVADAPHGCCHARKVRADPAAQLIHWFAQAFPVGHVHQ